MPGTNLDFWMAVIRTVAAVVTILVGLTYLLRL